MAIGQINFRWAAPRVAVPEGSRFKTSGAQQAFDDVASSIASAKQSQYKKEQDRLARERQSMLDARNEEDRQRRIAEEDRKKKAWGTLGDAILGTAGIDVQKLQDEKNALLAELQELGG